jgi:hypothetical protein
MLLPENFHNNQWSSYKTVKRVVDGIDVFYVNSFGGSFSLTNIYPLLEIRVDNASNRFSLCLIRKS